jgi:WD40 repeat protein
LLYAVHDEGRKDTQFFTVDPSKDFKVELLGTMHYEQDIEALDIHPTTNQIFAAAGDDGTSPGHLYQVDAKTGELSLVGDTGFLEINGLSFKKEDDGSQSLWGWAEHDGLIKIDTKNGAGSLELTYKKRVEDITWDNEGNLLVH